MKVGTVETIEEKEKKRKISSSLGSGFGSNGGNKNGGGGGSNGGDNNNRNNDSFEAAETYQSNKFRIAMWFLLLVVMMTFGGLISAYVVISTNGVMEWKPFDLPIQVWISTNLILASSIAYTVSHKALSLDNQKKAKNWLLATTIFGGMFIGSQIMAWLELVRRGIYVQSNPYAGFFYVLTSVHALHVVVGISALGYILLRTWEPTSDNDELTKRKQVSNTVGWFWHFMDALWIVLVLLLAFWK